MAHAYDGRRIAGLVLLMIVLTAVIPPVAAYTLARWRITTASETAVSAARVLSRRHAELARAAGTRGVLMGPDRLPPGQGPGAPWTEAPVAVGADLAAVWPRDPWGRTYLLDVRGVLAGTGGLLLSAGPNGTIDTPLSATAPSGDDIAALVR